MVYADPDTAIRDVTGYLRSRALTFVRFGLHAGELPSDAGIAERLAGPVVDAALRLAERAASGQLWLSSAVRDLLTAPVPTLAAVDGTTYRLSRDG